ncbi:MAG: division/cell wall cluster transcriptional repressor MraZ [Actinobacteria bacterium]|nr:MAG: division/cell wall cluster transcriptional repressor MraZ [Actinomycetota bacterium]
MLLGEFEHTVDDKNRLTLPAKFRQALSGGLVITRGMDGCLYCYPQADWERLVESRLAGLDPLSREGRLMHRFFFAGASEAEPDKQGRVALPPTLAKDLGREVVVAGVNDHLEIWNREAWRDHVKVMEGSAEDVAERLATQRD